MQTTRKLTGPQAKIYAAGFRPAQIARITGLCETSVSQTLRCANFSPRTQRLIAEAVGMRPIDLWGEYLHPSLRVDRDPNVVSKPHLSPIQGESVKSQNAA